MSSEIPLTRPKVTIEDIAREAGVHPASVSRALRGVGTKVSPQTKLRIEGIAERLGYRPNAVAASLRTKKTHLVGIVVPDLGNPLFGPIVQGIETELRQRGYMSLIAQTPADMRLRKDVIEALVDRQVTGLVILAAESDDPMLESAQRAHVPTVLVNRGFGERRFSSIVNDDRESVRLVLEHLVGLGHTEIGHIAGPATSSTGRSRREAFDELAQPLGVRASVVMAVSFTRTAGLAAARELLDRSPVTAIFGANDLIAMGVLDALKERGLSVPSDVSLVGHNDMPFVDLIAPPLTTVRVAVDQMSRQAAQLLIELVDMPDQPPSMRVLLPTLIVRESTAPARPRTDAALAGVPRFKQAD
ncbi:LacI family DNA-binding transcriptional regulator [Methylibium sp.]|uniref:LacI family DNA-binding transcriptional regulator n=1 Tax=Methylibium sp. TaxID=2067992 RepID=UPI003D142311